MLPDVCACALRLLPSCSMCTRSRARAAPHAAGHGADAGPVRVHLPSSHRGAGGLEQWWCRVQQQQRGQHAPAGKRDVAAGQRAGVGQGAGDASCNQWRLSCGLTRAERPWPCGGRLLLAAAPFTCGSCSHAAAAAGAGGCCAGPAGCAWCNPAGPVWWLCQMQHMRTRVSSYAGVPKGPRLPDISGLP